MAPRASAACRERAAPPVRRRGFGLLEVLVALVLVSGAGLALMTWIQQNLQAAARLAEHDERVRLESLASAWVAALNPMQQPSGEAAIGPDTLRWSSRLLEPVRPNSAFDGESSGRWELGLYEVEARLTARASGIEVAIVQWQTGMRALRSAPGQP